MNNFSITYSLDDKRIIPFLYKEDRASIYHHPAWLKAISKTFGHIPFYLLLENEKNEISGLIPFIKISSLLTGKRLVSVPFSTYCEPLLPLEEKSRGLEFIYNEFGQKFKIDLRTKTDLTDILHDYSHSLEYYTHILTLKDNLDETFDSFHPRSIRGSIRRAEKNDLSIRFESTENDLKIFYNLEAQLRQRLAFPPLPYSFFFNVYKELKPLGLLHIHVVEKNKLPIAAAFILNFKDTFYLEYAASDKNYIGLYPNHKLYWEIIKTAFNRGAKKIDFGRTSIDNEPLIIFKEKWNAERFSLYHFNYPNKGVIKKNNGKLKNIMIKLNSRIPVSLLKLEGSLLYPHLD